MNQIYITMLGRFDFFVDGESAIDRLGNSTKSILLLQYLILNRNKSITVSELIDLFWSEPEKSANPESALKTMVSRIRSNLAQVNPILKNCIVSEKKSYMWNYKIPYSVDAFQFEKLCKQLQKKTDFSEEVNEQFLHAINLYSGDLFSPAPQENWIISRSLYLHHLYLKTIYHYISFLKQDKNFDMVIHVCRLALDIDAFDEAINLELMNALKESGHNSSALQQYRHITDAYQKYLGIEPSEKILRFYKELVKSDLASEADIITIRQELKKAQNPDRGPFVCDYSIFKDIYQLQIRSLDRNNQKMFLALFTINSVLYESEDLLLLDTIMRELLEVIRQCLRKGDTVSRYSPSQYAVLLPMLDYSNGHSVMNRIKKTFYKTCSLNNIKLGFQLNQLD